MRSLFARIWLSYSLVIVLTLAGAAGINFAFAIRRAEQADRVSPVTLAQSAKLRVQALGSDGLIDWIMQEAHSNPDLYIYVVDRNGRDVLDRRIVGRSLTGPQGGAVPELRVPNGRSFRLLVRRSDSLSFGIRDLVLQPYVLLVLAVLVSGLGSAVLALYMTRPIVKLRAGVRSFAAGNLDTRIGGDLVERRDELGELAQDFDQMAQKLRAQIAAKEELLRDVSHELRSPLARLRVAAELFRRHADESNVATFDRIGREVQRLDELIGQILRFSRLGSHPTLNTQTFDLVELLEETVADAQMEATPSAKFVNLTIGGACSIIADRSSLRSAIENVLRNAVRFAPIGTVVEVRLTVQSDKARVEVIDQGPGVNSEDLSRLFEPFYRGRCPDGVGVGLGLAIAQKAVSLHCGELCASNGPERGLIVTFMLPIETVEGDRRIS